tara:strand:- start:287 stop:1198 length:912 start_codon:yes stop_codon:yes gene_type:complete
MSFEIIILGCGSASPTSLRNPSSQFVSIQENFFLIDCGEGTQIQLRKHKIRMQRIKHIFISHLHGDHFFGLPGLLSTFHLLGRTNELNIYGPSGLKLILDSLFKASQTYLKFKLNFHSLSFDAPELIFQNKKLEVYSFPMRHSIEVCGFKFIEKPKPRKINRSATDAFEVPHYVINSLKEGADFIKEDGQVVINKKLTFDPDFPKSYAYCSDTAYFPKICQSIKGVDFLYHEATFTNDMEKLANKTKHSTAKQAALIALEANVKNLIIGHFSARYTRTDNLLNEAREIFKNSTVAEDGLKIII